MITKQRIMVAVAITFAMVAGDLILAPGAHAMCDVYEWQVIPAYCELVNQGLPDLAPQSTDLPPGTGQMPGAGQIPGPGQTTGGS